MTTGVVLARVGGTFRVHVAGAEVTATLRGRLKHRDDDRVVVGTAVRHRLCVPAPRAAALRRCLRV